MEWKLQKKNTNHYVYYDLWLLVVIITKPTKLSSVTDWYRICKDYTKTTQTKHLLLGCT